MKRLIFAANWKMHLGPYAARDFLTAFLDRYGARDEREVWFFPGAVAVESVARAAAGRADVSTGAQNVHWAETGAFTGEISVGMAAEAGARAALVGHSERRHVFGETDEETGKKVRVLVTAGLVPVLCVGEKLEERERGETIAVVERQLSVLEEVEALDDLIVAYEPVWAIGTGKVATPDDAGQVHSAIRSWLTGRGIATTTPILYGGSVKPDNASALISRPEIDGVLVGGASLDVGSWQAIVEAAVD